MSARDTLERAAYSAVGAPIAGAKAAREKVEELRSRIRKTRADLKDDATAEFESWIAEGEDVIDRFLEKLRSTGAGREMRLARRTAAENVRDGVSEVSRQIDRALDIIEPEIDLREIKGIGPAAKKQLTELGVQGIASFLDRTSSADEISDLANKAKLSEDTIIGWRKQADLSRIKGIGDGYRLMLNAVGVGTIAQLANADAAKLMSDIEKLDRPGLPDQLPNQQTLREWITKAGRKSLE